MLNIENFHFNRNIVREFGKQELVKLDSYLKTKEKLNNQNLFLTERLFRIDPHKAKELIDYLEDKQWKNIRKEAKETGVMNIPITSSTWRRYDLKITSEEYEITINNPEKYQSDKENSKKLEKIVYREEFLEPVELPFTDIYNLEIYYIGKKTEGYVDLSSIIDCYEMNAIEPLIDEKGDIMFFTDTGYKVSKEIIDSLEE